MAAVTVTHTSAPRLASFTKESVNYSRLCYLLVDGGTKALRHTFDTFHPPATLHRDLADPLTHSTLLTLKKKRILNAKQWDKLYPARPAAVTAKNFDTTLLTVLLKSICGLTRPATGWDNLPPSSDASVEANIARVKVYRNEVQAHASKASVDDVTFVALWQDISDALIALGLDAATVHKFKTDSMDPVVEEHYQKLMDQWRQDEQSFMFKIEEMEGVNKCCQAPRYMLCEYNKN